MPSINGFGLVFSFFFSDFPERDDTCILCKQSLDNGTNTTTVTPKGVSGLKKANRARGETGLIFSYWSDSAHQMSS